LNAFSILTIIASFYLIPQIGIAQSHFVTTNVADKSTTVPMSEGDATAPVILPALESQALCYTKLVEA
jgi:hypothetical protein